jgi:hypothetical protein
MRAMTLAVKQLGPLPERKIVRSHPDNSHYNLLEKKKLIENPDYLGIPEAGKFGIANLERWEEHLDIPENINTMNHFILTQPTIKILM